MTTTPSTEVDLSSVRYGNDIQLASLVTELNKRIPLLNHYLANGQLDKAWVMAEAVGQLARAAQYRLNDIIFAKGTKCN